MSRYIQLPDNSYVEIPEGMGDDEARQKVLLDPRFRPIIEQAISEQSRLIPDLAGSGVRGLGAIPTAIGTLTGLVPGMQDNVVSRGLVSAGEYLSQRGNAMMSPGGRMQQELFQAIMDEADKQGLVGQAKAALREAISNPRMLANITAESIPSLVGSFGGGFAVRGAASVGSRLAGRPLGAEGLRRAGVAGAIGTESLLEGGGSAADVYKEIKGLKEEELQKSPEYQELLRGGLKPEDARESLARSAARQAAAQTAAISGTIGAALPGVETMPFARASTATRARRVSTGAGTEAVQEAGQEGGVALSENIARQRAEIERELTAGVGSRATLGALVGGITGGAFGGLRSQAPDVDRTEDAELRQALQAGQPEFQRAAAGEFVSSVLPVSQEEFANASPEVQQRLVSIAQERDSGAKLVYSTLGVTRQEFLKAAPEQQQALVAQAREAQQARAAQVEGQPPITAQAGSRADAYRFEEGREAPSTAPDALQGETQADYFRRIAEERARGAREAERPQAPPSTDMFRAARQTNVIEPGSYTEETTKAAQKTRATAEAPKAFSPIVEGYIRQKGLESPRTPISIPALHQYLAKTFPGKVIPINQLKEQLDRYVLNPQPGAGFILKKTESGSYVPVDANPITKDTGEVKRAPASKKESEEVASGERATPMGVPTAPPEGPGFVLPPDVKQTLQDLRKGVKPQQQSLVQFLKKAGGLNNTGYMAGEVSNILGSNKALPGLINNQPRTPIKNQNGKTVGYRGGLTLDRAREKLVEEGFLPEDADINDMLNAIREELSGGGVNFGLTEDYEGQERQRAAQQLERALDEAGVTARDSDEDIARALGFEVPSAPVTESDLEALDQARFANAPAKPLGPAEEYSARNQPGQATQPEQATKPSPAFDFMAVINDRLNKIKAKGKQGEAIATAIERDMKSGKYQPEQIYAAFKAGEVMAAILPAGANHEIRFVERILKNDIEAQGRRLAPIDTASAGIIEISLSDSVLGMAQETAAHEAFHVLQDYYGQYDPAFKKLMGQSFKDNMTLDQVDSTIKRKLQTIRMPGSKDSYWDFLKSTLPGNIESAREAEAYVFGSLHDAAKRGVPMTGLKPSFTRFVNMLTKFTRRMGNSLRGDGFNSPDDVFGRVVEGDAGRFAGEAAPEFRGGEYSARVTKSEKDDDYIQERLFDLMAKPGPNIIVMRDSEKKLEAANNEEMKFYDKMFAPPYNGKFSRADRVTQKRLREAVFNARKENDAIKNYVFRNGPGNWVEELFGSGFRGEALTPKSMEDIISEAEAKISEATGIKFPNKPYFSRGVETESQFNLSNTPTKKLISSEEYSARLPPTIEVDGVQRPTINSEGRSIHPTEEGVRNFWRWFGDSKVVDDQGRPLVVYHGTNESFNKFSEEFRGKNTESESAYKGFFFSKTPQTASSYARGIDRKLGDLNGLDNDLFAALDVDGLLSDGSYNGPLASWARKFRREDFGLFQTISEMLERSQNDSGGSDLIDASLRKFFVFFSRKNIPTPQKQIQKIKSIMSREIKSATGFSFSDKIAEKISEAMSLYFPDGIMIEDVEMAGGNVIPTYLKIQNPKLVDFDGGPRWDSFSNLLDEAADENKDGAIFRNVADPFVPDDIFIAFSPTQIKSAIGNTGAFSPNDARIEYSARTLPKISAAHQSAIDKVTGTYGQEPDSLFRKALDALTGARAKYTFLYGGDKPQRVKASDSLVMSSVNQFHAGHLADQLLKSKGRPDAAIIGRSWESANNNDARIAYMMNGGGYRLDKIRGVLVRDPKVKSIKDMFANKVPTDEKGQKRFQAYAVANLERDLRKQGKKGFLNLTDAEVASVIQESERSFPQWKEVIKDLNNWNNSLLQLLVDAGNIDQATKDKLMQVFYTPLYRKMEDDAYHNADMVMGPATAGTFKNPSDALKKREGGEEPIGDLFENIVRNADAIVKSALKNVAMENTAKGMEIAGLAEKVPARLDGAKNIMTLRRDGKDVHYRVDDPLMMIAISTAPMQIQNGFYKTMASVSGFIRDMITLAPSFMLANLWRGKVVSYVQEGVPLWRSTTVGLRDALKQTTSMTSIGDVSGFGGYTWGQGSRDVVSELKRQVRLADGTASMLDRAKSIVQGLRHVGEATEFAERVKVVDHLISKGMNPDDAAFQGYLLAPFSRRGMGTGFFGSTASFLAPIVPFLNAKIQGTYRLLENEKNLPKHKFAMQLMARGAVVTMFSMALAALASDDERWNDEPVERKMLYDIFYVGDKTILLPRAFEVGTWFGAIPVMLFDAARKEHGGDLGKAFAFALTNTLGFSPIPASVAPLITVATNYDFFMGRELESAGMRSRPASERSQEDTSRVAEGVAYAINNTLGELPRGMRTELSPIQVQALLQGYLGTAGTMVLSAVDGFLGWSGMTPGKPAGPLGDPNSLAGIATTLTGVRRFIKGDEEKVSRFVGDFYDLKREVTQWTTAMNDARLAGDMARANEIASERSDLFSLKKQVDKASRDVGEISRRMRAIQNNPNMDPQEKADALVPLRQRRNEITGRIMEQAMDRGVR